MKQSVKTFRAEAYDCLNNNILPFWLNMQDEERGGFYGQMTGRGTLVKDAEKGAVLNARILWSFAAAYRVTGNAAYLDAATRAKDYIMRHFIDREYGGVYWSLNADGTPKDTKKQSYAIGFTIYGLSEYARCLAETEEQKYKSEAREALEMAISLFNDLESHAYDPAGDGYIEALTRDWQPLEDMRLSELDENGSRTMNTHLHIIEPYTNLYRVWKDERLEKAIRRLLDIFTDKIMNPANHHLDLFFDDNWQGKRDIQSYGHDIEGSWLLHETALVLNDKETLARIEQVIRLIAVAASKGIIANGAMMHETNLPPNPLKGEFDFDSDFVSESVSVSRSESESRPESAPLLGGWGADSGADLHWWVQCENIIGNFNLYQHFGDEQALEKALRCWQWTKENLIDRQNGEWHWSVRHDGTLNLDDDKAGFWKCPYHNSRMCLEIIERTSPLTP